MNLLPETKNCTGCSACVAACVRSAIRLVADKEGFLCPQVDVSVCVECGRCAKVCPSLNVNAPRKPLSVYAAMAVDDKLRRESSSGGVFSLLATDVLAEGGLVFGAAFDHSDWHVFHRSVDSECDLAGLRGSKYVQSDMGDAFRQVADALKSGREVLFSGTPCQIAGLRNYLTLDAHADMDRLLLVDVVCHATPSPLAWRKYLENRVLSVYNGRERGLGNIRRISFRRKNRGWKRYSLSLCFVNDKEYLSVFMEDIFMRGFLAELYNRPSCHNCPCKELKSGSDITIADYWGVTKLLPDMDDDLGTSLVLVNSEKGEMAFKRIAGRIKCCESSFEHAYRTNPAIVRPTKPHRNRAKFFMEISNKPFDKVVKSLLRPPFMSRLSVFMGRQLRRLGFRK